MSGFAEGLRIRIKYLSDKIPPLEYIGGGSRTGSIYKLLKMSQ